MSRLRSFHPWVAVTVAAGLTGCASGSGGSEVTPVANAAAPASNLQITDIKTGNGLTPRPGQTCTVHYTGWLYVSGAKGKKFDSSVDRKVPFSFVMGDHKVIEGWERGVATMKPGGKRTLIIPPELAYGSAGNGAVPPNATLIFEVELLEVKAAS